MANIYSSLFKPRCWVCWGKGWVKGPLYTETCPNENCPHREKDAKRNG